MEKYIQQEGEIYIQQGKLIIIYTAMEKKYYLYNYIYNINIYNIQQLKFKK